MKILMVCLGNICRSPLAHGILEQKLTDRGINAYVDSAGTNGFHNGELPDSRSMEIALRKGLDISHQRSRQITKQDLRDFDLIYVMDQSNYNNVLRIASEDQYDKVKMIMNESQPGKNISVPDPYYGGAQGFENVHNMLDEACEAIIKNQF
ncbi:MAG: low molecular weight phosphotyrosine protein phosphatase [Flavobacteriales bacterium]|nr:low molecular weight phosphotyrosine protein phosphatase [Flavobacteriales bacterium]